MPRAGTLRVITWKADRRALRGSRHGRSRTWEVHQERQTPAWGAP